MDQHRLNENGEAQPDCEETVARKENAIPPVPGKELSFSEKNFRVLMNNTSDIIARFDREKRFLYVNLPAMAIRAHPLEDYPGKTMRELDYPEAIISYIEEKLDTIFKNTSVAMWVNSFFHRYYSLLAEGSHCAVDNDWPPEMSLCHISNATFDFIDIYSDYNWHISTTSLTILSQAFPSG